MLALLSRYKLILELLAFLALAGGIAFGAHRFLDYERDIGYQKAVAEYTARDLLQAKANAADTARLTKQLEDAQNAARDREKLLTDAAAGSSTAVAGLRGDLAALRRGLPGASADASRQAADALAAVFGDCAGKYRDLAAIADHHASDVKTLTDAWPK